ncbi:hypothetical protein [Natrononativus amylolyticus]|uniref:hypothetical protein n=1 Tax=Natrononativus amylolyticus TaxID=2963434 RepID=UPI0020CDC40D|nr:hypothetical protein [Natrononativus amylolyticus]
MYLQYPDDWDPQDCLLVVDALVRYAQWDCDDDREKRAVMLAHEVAESQDLTLEDAIQQVDDHQIRSLSQGTIENQSDGTTK